MAEIIVKKQSEYEEQREKEEKEVRLLYDAVYRITDRIQGLFDLQLEAGPIRNEVGDLRGYLGIYQKKPIKIWRVFRSEEHLTVLRIERNIVILSVYGLGKRPLECSIYDSRILEIVREELSKLLDEVGCPTLILYTKYN